MTNTRERRESIRLPGECIKPEKPIKPKLATYNDHRKDPPYCWRVGGPVTLDPNGTCPECGWKEKDGEEETITWSGWRGCLKAMMYMSTSSMAWSETQLLRSLKAHGYSVTSAELSHELKQLVDMDKVRLHAGANLYRWVDEPSNL